MTTDKKQKLVNELLERIQNEIFLCPTGNLRNLLTDANIVLQSTLLCEQGKEDVNAIRFYENFCRENGLDYLDTVMSRTMAVQMTREALQSLPQSKEDLEGVAEKLRDATQSIKLYFNCKYEFELDAKDIDMILEIYQDTFQSLPSQSLVKEIERIRLSYDNLGSFVQLGDTRLFIGKKALTTICNHLLTFAGKSEVGK